MAAGAEVAGHSVPSVDRKWDQAHPQGPASSSQAPPPKTSTGFPDSAADWGPNVQTQGPTAHSNHSTYSVSFLRRRQRVGWEALPCSRSCQVGSRDSQSAITSEARPFPEACSRSRHSQPSWCLARAFQPRFSHLVSHSLLLALHPSVEGVGT